VSRNEFCGTEGQLFETHKTRTNGIPVYIYIYIYIYMCVCVCVCVCVSGVLELSEMLNMSAFLDLFYKESIIVYGKKKLNREECASISVRRFCNHCKLSSVFLRHCQTELCLP